jgi:hypothetical protein
VNDWSVGRLLLHGMPTCSRTSSQAPSVSIREDPPFPPFLPCCQKKSLGATQIRSNNMHVLGEERDQKKKFGDLSVAVEN